MRIVLILLMQSFFTLSWSWAQTNDQGKMLKTAYEKLEQRNIEAAKEDFRRLIQMDPSNDDAKEGLIWCLVNEGGILAAINIAEKRMAGKTIDDPWYPKYLEVIRISVDHREKAIKGFREYLAAHPDNNRVRELFAETLSWNPESKTEAMKEYRRLLEDKRNQSVDLRFKYSRFLLDSGQIRTATKYFSKLLKEDPTPRSYLGLAQSYHWSGQIQMAAKVLSSATWLFPNDEALKAEQKLLQLEAPTIEEVFESSQPHLNLYVDFTKDTSGFSRKSLISQVRFRLAQNVFVRPMLDVSHIEDSVSSLDRQMLGAEFKTRLSSSFNLSVSPGLVNSPKQKAKGIWDAHLSWGQTGVPLKVNAGNRLYRLIDGPCRYDEADIVLAGIPSGLSVEESESSDLNVNETYGTISGSFDGYYGYLSPSMAKFSDGNSKTQVAGGFGLVIFSWLRVKADYYSVRYDTLNALYFSPDLFSIVTPSLDLEWRPEERMVLGLNVGKTQALTTTAQEGSNYSLFMKWSSLEGMGLSIRVQETQQSVYKTQQLLLGFNSQF